MGFLSPVFFYTQENTARSRDQVSGGVPLYTCNMWGMQQAADLTPGLGQHIQCIHQLNFDLNTQKKGYRQSNIHMRISANHMQMYIHVHNMCSGLEVLRLDVTYIHVYTTSLFSSTKYCTIPQLVMEDDWNRSCSCQ